MLASRACRSISKLPLPHPYRTARFTKISPFHSTMSYNSLKVPEGAWDSHMHITDSRFPTAKEAVYQPHHATLPQALENARRLGVPNLVFVQVSVYGYDNSCQIFGLDSLEHQQGRGVVVCDPDNTSLDQLREWHKRGVRGIRVNLKSVKREMAQGELAELLLKYAKLIRPMKTWAIQCYVEMATIPQLLPLMDKLECKMVVDHLGGPPRVSKDMDSCTGWQELLQLLERDDFFVKISAPYRFSSDPQFRDLEPLVKQLLGARGGNGVVFASDWPHTRFEGTDILPWVDRCLEWCDGDHALAAKLFRENAKRLWDVPD